MVIAEDKKILAVDDEQIMRDIYFQVFHRAGYPIDLARDATEALAMLMANPSDYGCAIIDYYMPGMNGVDLVKRIKTSDLLKNIPVLMISTENDSACKKRGREAGAVTWITKPVTNNQLLKAVSTYA